MVRIGSVQSYDKVFFATGVNFYLFWLDVYDSPLLKKIL